MSHFALPEAEIKGRAAASQCGNCVDVGGGFIPSGENTECNVARLASETDRAAAAVSQVMAMEDRRKVSKAEL